MFEFHYIFKLIKKFLFLGVDNQNSITSYSTFDFDGIDIIETNENKQNHHEIYVNLHAKNGTIQHTFSPVDRCCKNIPNMNDDKFLWDMALKYGDTIPRISCDISKEEFYEKYVQKREAVLMSGCQDNWKAKDWTIKGKYPF